MRYIWYIQDPNNEIVVTNQNKLKNLILINQILKDKKIIFF